jgi:conjugative transfer region lipoprotein (TIGR03751 family)
VRRNSIEIRAAGFVLLAIAAILGGCATNKDDLLPHGDQTMLDIWQRETGGAGGSLAARQLLDARQPLRRPLPHQGSDARDQGSDSTAYTRTAANEIYRQFHRLPNPDLTMYVFPHLAGSDPTPVPGYTTVFPLYQRVRYAMPGERVKDY